MFTYMSDCLCKQLMHIANQPETRPITNLRRIDNTGKTFLRTLKITYDAARSRKQNQFCETKETMEVIEGKLNTLYENIYDRANSTNITQTDFNNVINLATSYCNMGIICSSDTSKQKLLACQEYLMKSLELLKGKELHCRAILIFMRVSWQLEQLFHKLNEPEKYYPFSHKALDLYHEYTKCGNDFAAPIVVLSVSLDIEDEAHENCDRKRKLDTKISLLTLYSHTLNHVLDMVEPTIPFHLHSLANVAHNFLKHMLKTVIIDPLSNAMQWICAAWELHVYFLRHCRFNEARDCLAAAQFLLTVYERELLKKATADNVLPEDIRPTHDSTIKGFLNLGWSNYDIRLFLLSQYSLSYDTDIETRKANVLKLTGSEESTIPLIFTDLKEHVENIISEVTDTYLSNTEDARTLFVHCIKWLGIANRCLGDTKKFGIRYTAIIANNFAAAYKYRACFESDKDEKIKLLKCQAHMLHHVYNFSLIRTPEVLDFYSMIFMHIISALNTILDSIIEDAENTGEPYTSEIIRSTEVRRYVQLIVWNMNNVPLLSLL